MGNSFRSKRDITVAVLGIDGAGKSTFLQNLTEDEIDEEPLPTVGYTTRRYTQGRYNILLTEVGGGVHIRGVWQKYYAQCHALIYIVDGTSDSERLKETKEELRKVLVDERIKCKPLLILCNKNDLPDCISAVELVRALSLSELLKESFHTELSYEELITRVWLCTCLRVRGRRDPQLKRSLKWLLKKVTDDWTPLAQRVIEQHGVELEQKERDRQARIAQRKQRLEEEERLEREALAAAEQVPDHEQEEEIATEPGAITVIEAETLPPVIANDRTSDASQSHLELLHSQLDDPKPRLLQPITGSSAIHVFISDPPPPSLSSDSNNTMHSAADEGNSSTVNRPKIAKTTQIVRRLKNRNKLVPVDSDVNTTLSFASKPPLPSPWISNDEELPLVAVNPSQTSVAVETVTRTQPVIVKQYTAADDETSVTAESSGLNGLPAVPITNHSSINISFTLPQDVILSRPLSN